MRCSSRPVSVLIAYASAVEGIDALVVMWQTASPMKISAARGYGATIDTEAADIPSAFERLNELTAAGHDGQEDDAHYRLSALGQALREAIEPLDHWARTWAEQSTGPTP